MSTPNKINVLQQIEVLLKHKTGFLTEQGLVKCAELIAHEKDVSPFVETEIAKLMA